MTKFTSTLRLLSLAALLGALVFPAAAAAQGNGKERHPRAGRAAGKKQHPGNAEARRRERPRAAPPEARAWQEHRGWQNNGGWQGHDNWEGGRAGHWQAEHRTWADRGGYHGYYVRRNVFHLYFGPAHYFRIRTRPVIYEGYPRFAYQGYSFLLVDPWPEDWDEDWYESDDVYIVYDHGYYLYNRSRPGIGLAITIIE